MCLLFAYDRYYPQGAASDFVCKYVTMRECLNQIKLNTKFDYVDVYDVMRDEWHNFSWGPTDGKIYFKNEYFNDMLELTDKRIDAIVKICDCALGDSDDDSDDDKVNVDE